MHLHPEIEREFVGRSSIQSLTLEKTMHNLICWPPKALSNLNPMRMGKLLLPCIALSVMLFSGAKVSATESGQSAQPAIQIAQAPAIPSRVISPKPAATPAAPIATDENPDNARLGVSIKGHCYCDVTCRSSKGQTSSPGETTLGGKLWQHLAADRAECQNRCQAHINANIQTWGAQGKMCDSVTCTGTSWVGTNKERRTSQHSIDRGSTPDCRKVDPTGNACCPEFTKTITPGNIASFFTESQHGIGQPYTMTFNSNGTFSNAFEASLKSWADWLRADGCPNVVGFKVDYQLYNTNSPVKPTGIGAIGSYTAGALQSVTYISGNVVPATFTWNIAPSPNWWFVKVNVTPIGKNGQPVTCAKASGCYDRFYTGWIDDAVNMKTAAGAQSSVRRLD
jgi:hypothetical protein